MKRLNLYTALLVCALLFIASCKKSDAPSEGHGDQTKTYSSQAGQKWQDLQLRFLRLSGTNVFGMNGNRNFAYCGIALYEAVLPGMPGYWSLSGQLTDMPTMPAAERGKTYYWPASANAALAFLNKSLYNGVSDANKTSMDSLEAALNADYQSKTSAEIFQRSVNFGRTIAERIFEWSKGDGSLTVHPPYVPATGPGFWSPTPPNPTTAFAPYWGTNRLFVQGSTTGTASPLPPPYSTDPGSAYYAMVKEVYDISKTLTPEQTATALYFRDNPGFQAGTHYIAIFNQVLAKENPPLDFYAVAHAKTGIAIAESQINCWKIKYDALVERPVRYIRNVMGHTTWNPVLATPPHPDFPSGHSQTGGAFATVMTSLFGNSYPLTIRTYDNLGMAPRTYNSFTEMAEDIGKSRVYAGIHYTYSCTEGYKQGAKIAANILNALKFKK